MKRVYALLLMVCCGVSGFAQSAPSAPYSENGAYAVINASGSKDHISGYSMQLASGVGYDLTRALSVEAGISYYPVLSSEAITTTGSTKQKVSNELGDAYCTIAFGSKLESLSYQGALQGTEPTGSSSVGISTGRATWHSNNHLETDLGPVTPFIEAGIGNSLADTRRSITAPTQLWDT